MTMVNIAEAKAHLSEILERVAQGEEIMICKRNVPVASLKAAKQAPKKRPLGMFRGVITYTDDCFAPLTELELREWGL